MVFLILNHPCMPGMKPILMDDCLDLLWTWFARILLCIFPLIFIREVGLNLLGLYVVMLSAQLWLHRTNKVVFFSFCLVLSVGNNFFLVCFPENIISRSIPEDLLHSEYLVRTFPKYHNCSWKHSRLRNPPSSKIPACPVPLPFCTVFSAGTYCQLDWFPKDTTSSGITGDFLDSGFLIPQSEKSQELHGTQETRA